MVLLSSPPAWSQQSSDWWKTEGKPALSKLRDCVVAHANRDPEAVQGEKWSALLLAAIEGDCRPVFDGMVQIFAEHIDAKEVEAQLQTIAQTTLLPALKARRGDDGSTAQIEETPSPAPARVQTDRITPDPAGGRRALQSDGGPRHGSPPKSSAEWLDHCRAKYTSFNPQTGKYKSYSGTYRPCR